MAKACRIDDVIRHPDGRIEIRFTEGETPLPPTWPGTAVIYPDGTSLAEDLTTVEGHVEQAGILRHVQMAAGYKLDPSLGPNFVGRVKGRTTTLDLTGLPEIIRIG